MSLRRNTIFGALGFLLPTAVVFLAYPAVLRHLGAEQMGVYILAISLSGSFAFLEFGLTTVTTKLVAEAVAGGDPDRASDAVVTSTAFYLALGALGLSVLFFAAPALARWTGATDTGTATRVFRIAAFLLLSTYLNNVAASVLKGLHRFDLATGQAVASSVTSWGGAVAVLAWGGGILSVAGMALASSGLIVLASYAATTALCRSRGIRLMRGRPRARMLRGMFRLGIFMSINGLLGVLVNQVQSLVLARLLTASAVAIWGTAVQIVSKINALTSAAFEIVLPVAAELAEHSVRTQARLRMLRSIYLKALGLSLLFSIAASGALYVIAPPLIGFWLRSPIDASIVAVLRILCIGLAVNGATPVVFHLLNGIGRPEVNTASMALGTLILYGTLVALSQDGVTIERFAIATTVALVVNGILYFAYAEAVVWRRWLAPGSAAVATPNA
ncbi:MAG TPA: oligosaccharide flippase family protein [Actinomycetota bacterium]|nr:oligosaccharide flippase family protein [Actinomycetota bacterium]